MRAAASRARAIRSPAATMRSRLCTALGLPADLVQAHGVLEAAQGDIPPVREEEAFARRQLAHDVGDQDLAGLRLGADPGGELDGGAEQVLLLGHGLAGVEADAHPNGRPRLRSPFDPSTLLRVR